MWILGQIAVEDMDGGTFTVSNGGVFGSLLGTPIINPPQSAILGMHGIFDRPVAIKGQVKFNLDFLYFCFYYYYYLILLTKHVNNRWHDFCMWKFEIQDLYIFYEVYIFLKLYLGGKSHF